MKTQHQKVRVLTTLSSCVEFYDFSLIVFLAPTLSHVFYPSHFHQKGILEILGIFAFGYLSRIAGGIIFGKNGDSHGRKTAFLFSISLMAMATFAIALLPSYQNLGYLGALGLMVLRLVQGLALGGQVPGAIVFCSEHNKAKKRGFSTSLIVFGVTFGNVLASGLLTLLTSLLTRSEFLSWGWRIMFVVGGCLSLISLMLRFSVSETPYYKKLHNVADRVKHPTHQLIHRYPNLVINGFLLASLPAICISTFYQIINLQTSLHVLKNTIHFFIFGSFILISTGAVIVGITSDKIGRIPIVQLSCAIFTLFPLSYFLFHKTNMLITFAPLLLGSTFILGVYTAMLSELFPTQIRYSGVALSYNLGFAICGGFTPVILEQFYQSGLSMFVSVLPCFVAVPLLFSTFFWKDNFNIPLANQYP